jgi:hypothetical protein
VLAQSLLKILLKINDYWDKNNPFGLPHQKGTICRAKTPDPKIWYVGEPLVNLWIEAAAGMVPNLVASTASGAAPRRNRRRLHSRSAALTG